MLSAMEKRTYQGMTKDELLEQHAHLGKGVKEHTNVVNGVSPVWPMYTMPEHYKEMRECSKRLMFISSLLRER